MDIYNSYTYETDKDGKSFEDYTREACFENYGEDEGWSSVDDVPDRRVQDEMEFDLEQQMDDFKSNLQKWIDDGHVFVLTGTCGRWDGTAAGGYIIRSVCDFFRITKDCDYISIRDDCGRLLVRCSHHDGTNYGEVRMLTPKGRAWLANHEGDYRSVVCETLFKNPFLSCRPHYARKWFGTEDKPMKKQVKKEA